MHDKVTLTLTLDYEVAQEVLALITRQQSNVKVPTSSFKLPEDKVLDSLSKVSTELPITYNKPIENTRVFPTLTTPVIVKPTAGKKTSMPSFGRSQAQIDAFAKAEESRVETLDEEAELKAQRAADRAEKKAIKEAEEADKAFQANKLAEEVKAIKASEVTTTPVVMPTKPWEI